MHIVRLLIVDLRWLKHIFFYITFLSYCWAMTGHFYILLSNIVQKIHICYGIDHCLVILSHLSVEIFRIRVRTSNKFQMQYIEYHTCIMIFVVPVGFFKLFFQNAMQEFYLPDEFISQMIYFCISCFPMVNLKIPLDFRILLAKSLPNFVKSCLSM